MTKILSFLLFAVLLGAPVAAGAGEQVGPPFVSSMSDDIFRSTAYNALQRSPSDTWRPTFTADHPNQGLLLGQLPFGRLRGVKVPIGNHWALAYSRDQFQGKVWGLTTNRAPDIPVLRNLLGLEKGTTNIGYSKDNVLSPVGQASAVYGIHFSYSFR